MYQIMGRTREMIDRTKTETEFMPLCETGIQPHELVSRLALTRIRAQANQGGCVMPSVMPRKSKLDHFGQSIPCHAATELLCVGSLKRRCRIDISIEVKVLYKEGSQHTAL